MKDQKCAYCVEGEFLAPFGLKICELDNALVYLFKEQSHKGRCIVATKSHVPDITQLSDEERNGYFADMAKGSGSYSESIQPR